jgi:Leucine-rich repeat (LRR) protein
LVLLNIRDNPNLTRAEVDKLMKALPKCKIEHNCKLSVEGSAALIEAAIRWQVNIPTGELTKAALEEVTYLDLQSNQLTDVSALSELTELTELGLVGNQLTDVSALAGLTQLEWLYLQNNPNLSKAEIDKLQKALPKCIISNTATA